MGGGARDHATYLLQRGAADVFFPTNFRMLGRLYEAAARAAPSPLNGAWKYSLHNDVVTQAHKGVVLLPTCFAWMAWQRWRCVAALSEAALSAGGAV